MSWEVLEWENCYKGNWKDRLNEESFEHPAKVSPGLSKRIYEFAFENGWLHPGDTVIDPFAGVAGFGYYAILMGLNFVGVELEQHFVDRAQGCYCTGISKDDWVRYHGRYRRAAYKNGRHWCPLCIRQAERKPLEKISNGQLSLFDSDDLRSAQYIRNSGKIPFTNPHPYLGNIMIWESLGMAGSGICLKGDSRFLEQILYGYRNAQAMVGSPPFLAQSGGTNVTSKSGALSDESLLKRHSAGNIAAKGYGETEGQLGTMEGDDLDAAISSPPWQDVVAGKEGHLKKYSHLGLGISCDSGDYGKEEGQLGNMEGDDLDAAISSPPYASELVHNRPSAKDDEIFEGRTIGTHGSADYGEEEGQLGNMKPESLDAAISSPPYADAMTKNRRGTIGLMKGEFKVGQSDLAAAQDGYGEEEGQLGNMQDENLDAAIGSPPYSTDVFPSKLSPGTIEHDRKHRESIGRDPDSPGSLAVGEYGTTPGQLSDMKDQGISAAISSPPYSELNLKSGGWQGDSNQDPRFKEYGETEGQLGQMPDQDIEAAVGSPPYAKSHTGGKEIFNQLEETHDREFTEKSRISGHPEEMYQENEGQLGKMPEGDINAAVTSPPYSQIEVANPTLKLSDIPERKEARSGETWEGYNRGNQDNISNLQEDDFWMAAKKVMQSTFNILKPGGYAFWVVKAFVKDKQIIDFPDQWRRICESVGFETVYEVRALLTETKSVLTDLEGNVIKKTVKRASFFRRLHEKKNPHLAIDWEVVWVMKKPEVDNG